MMDCERVRDLVELESGGKLAAGDWTQLASHVEDCAECRDYRVTLQATVRAMGHVTVEPFPENRSRKIMALVREMPSPERQSIWSRLSAMLTPSSSWGYAAVPGLAILLLVLWPRGGPQPAIVPRPAASQASPVQVASAPKPALGTLDSGDAVVTLSGTRLAAHSSGEFREGSEIVLESPAGSATLSYTDGTRIRLEQQARATTGPRSLHLYDGKALAAVSHTGAGFQLQACAFAVKVMGTRFSVDSAKCEVSLLEGKVQTLEGATSTVLSPGQAMVHEPGKARRRDLNAAEKRDLTLAFLAFEGAPRLAAALGQTEDSLRAFARPALPEATPGGLPASGSPPAAKTPPPTASVKPVAPFNPLQGLGK